MPPGHEDAGASPAERVTIWERIERPARGSRPALTHERIAAAAVAIADEEGLDAVSMRRLADRLGVATMALYRHVDAKSDVIELMIDAVHAEITPPSGDDWREVARGHARQSREIGLRHPWLTAAFSRTPGILTPNTVALAERALRSVDGLGLDVDSMMAVFATVNAYVRGATAGEIARRDAMRSRGWTSEEEARLAYLPYVRWLMGTGRYPTLMRYIVEGSNEDDAQWQFEFGLECVLDGIAARLGI